MTLSRKKLLLGLGNTILKDDGVGIYAVRKINERHPCNGWDIEESALSGGKLFDIIIDYHKILVVDSIFQEDRKPGEIMRFDLEDLETPFGSSPHYMGLPHMLHIAKQLDWKMPQQIRVVAINVKDPYTFHEGLSPEIEEAFPRFIREIEYEMMSID
ncbi:MAG: hydrogenase maturation protease [Acidobacteriota bacterium]